MNLSSFDYILPEEQIAQEPLPDRSAARMLFVRRDKSHLSHHFFRELPQLLQAGDLVVVNDSKVFPARLWGHLPGKRGSVEIMLIRRIDTELWEALVRPGRKIRQNAEVILEESGLARILQVGPFGRRTIRIEGIGDFRAWLDRHGETPLPPYIRRSNHPTEKDRLNYQTIYADASGSVAAPTAGLHFTHEVLEALRHSGISICEITLHVGYGTFQPIRTEIIEAHRMEPEYYSITSQAAESINAQKTAGRRILAVGTTTTRTLEAVAAAHQGQVVAGAGYTDLFIYPGFSFQIISGLITNFHLPRSSLLMLVAAFAGREWTLEWYGEAINAGYRFYSYGDCALIL